jgi:hypothetical protein
MRRTQQYTSKLIKTKSDFKVRKGNVKIPNEKRLILRNRVLKANTKMKLRG